MKKKVLLIPLALLLAVSLVACAAPAPTSAPAATVTAPAATVTAPAATVTAPAPAPAPAEVIKILMEVNSPSGWYVTAGEYLKDQLYKATDGRMQVELVLGEAIVPSAEQLDALRDGVFDMLLGWTSYYESKIPFLQVQAMADFMIRNPSDLWALYYEFGWADLSTQEYAKYNVQGGIGYFGHQSGYTMYSAVPVPDWGALKGMKIRTAGFMADVLEAAGASTVWIPGEEIYTALASGLIDAATYCNPATGLSYGWHEVTNYWVRPSLAEQTVYEVIANMDFWKSLSESDKVLIRNVTNAAGPVIATFGENYQDRIALDEVQKAGVELTYWDDNSLMQKTKLVMSLMPDWDDPAAAEAKESLLEYMRFAGYID